MKLSFQMIDPGGEGLLLVLTPVPREEYAPLTRRLLAIRELSPRQAAFLTAPAQGHTVLEGKVDSPLLWDGLEAPNCYTAVLTLEGAKEARV